MTRSYIGLISGTSMDGIDAVVASFENDALSLHATHAHPYPVELRGQLQAAIGDPDACSLDQLGALDRWTGECFLAAALAVIEKSGRDKQDIAAIGSHGQTLRHQPGGPRGYSLQIGNPATIAAGTGITTVSDFRRADIAVGGQGAPLTPAFHAWLFGKGSVPRVVVNIGGIANITTLPKDDAPVTGFDTGPGNTLLDAWIGEHRKLPYDDNGKWGASGTVIESLLRDMAADAYFNLPPPKSTGFEYFNLHWLRKFGIDDYAPADVQSTLCELSAITISNAIHRHAPSTKQVYVCGGGAHNDNLLLRIRRHLSEISLSSTEDAGLDPDWVEAAATDIHLFCRRGMAVNGIADCNGT